MSFQHSDRDDVKLHAIFKGEVASVQTYGVFVKIPGNKKQGLVHISQMSKTRVENPSDIVEKGDVVHCKVISMEADGEKIGLSMKVINQDTGRDLEELNMAFQHSDRVDLKLHAIFKGEVASVQTYGVFVKIPGNKKQGLVHISQMSKTRVENPSEIAEKGDVVHCKVVSMEADGEKIGLSMKVINQDTGRDLDPNNVQTSMDEQRRKSGGTYRKEKIQLEAVFDTTCKKCGGAGHLAQDCFHKPGGATYELVGEEDDVQPPQPTVTKKKHKKEKSKKKKKKAGKQDSNDENNSERHHKKKKHKKEKKGRKHDDSSSDSSSSEIEREKKQKKEKKRRKHDDSSSDSSSSKTERQRKRDKNRYTHSSDDHHTHQREKKDQNESSRSHGHRHESPSRHDRYERHHDDSHNRKRKYSEETERNHHHNSKRSNQSIDHRDNDRLGRESSDRYRR